MIGKWRGDTAEYRSDTAGGIAIQKLLARRDWPD
jgi:hypothetical protein